MCKTVLSDGHQKTIRAGKCQKSFCLMLPFAKLTCGFSLRLTYIMPNCVQFVVIIWWCC